MSTDHQGNDYESRYAHDLGLLFRVTARRNKLFGLWAAERLGKSPEDAEQYADDAVRIIYSGSGEDKIFEKVRADLIAAKLDMPETEIRRVMTQLMIQADDQLAGG